MREGRLTVPPLVLSVAQAGTEQENLIPRPARERSGPGLAFDRQRNRLIVYSGSNGFAALTDLWELE